MARPNRPSRKSTQAPVQTASGGSTQMVARTQMASAAVYRPGQKINPTTDRGQIAQPWQVELYRHINICGEARYAATLFSAIAGRAEIGVSEPHSLARKAVWVNEGPEVDAFATIAPTVRERTKLVRDYMMHRVIAGECYLISRERQPTDPEYHTRPWDPVWEIVAVTELRRVGERWSVRYDNNAYIDLKPDDPVIRMWVEDPSDRREAWSPFRSMLPTLQEIEWLTKHIFTQIRSRLMSSGVWFLPDNLTFPTPPPEAVEGGEEAIAQMNEAEQFMLSLAESSMGLLDGDDVAFPSIVMAAPEALANIDQRKLIQFWSEIDDKAMTLRTDAIQRFALGMDLPPEQVLGSSGIGRGSSGGSSGGSTNHWGIWANEEQTISSHIEPALDDFTHVLTTAFLRSAVEGTDKVIGYDTATLRLRQDRSKEALEWFDRGVLKAEVALRETGFDPSSDMMDAEEHRIWLLNRIVSGSATPEQMQVAYELLTKERFPLEIQQEAVKEAPGIPGNKDTPSLEDHPYEGPPRVDHEHNDAPYALLVASSEGLVLRALEKAGNRLLNNRTRGKDKDRTTPPHLAHLALAVETIPEFDFSMLPTVLGKYPAVKQELIKRKLLAYCARLYETSEAYSREDLAEELKDLTWLA